MNAVTIALVSTIMLFWANTGHTEVIRLVHAPSAQVCRAAGQVIKKHKDTFSITCASGTFSGRYVLAISAIDSQTTQVSIKFILATVVSTDAQSGELPMTDTEKRSYLKDTQELLADTIIMGINRELKEVLKKWG